MGSISIRRYIRWPPAMPQEPTSTIVLTSPARRFVDLRILDPTPAEAAAEQQQQKDGSTPPSLAAVVILPASRLDWAIAGTSESWKRTTTTPDGSEAVTRSRWTHWIDSRVPAGADPAAATDEGDMFPQGGDETLEKGRMVNPATGVEADYEELWADEAPAAIPAAAAAVVATPSGVGEAVVEDGPRCVVLRLEDVDRGARGVVVLLGRHCQGLIRVGEELGAERWQWREDEGWRAAARIGTVPVPCEQAFTRLSELLEVGKELRDGNNVWEVVEHA
ncbi:hypothetical protein RB597_004291 [Gaeumannomyces tritici]